MAHNGTGVGAVQLQNKTELMKIVKCIKCKYPFEMEDNFCGTILCESCDPHMNPKELRQPHVSWRSELLFAFRDYWRKSAHRNIDEAIKGFLRTKKGKQ